MYLYINVRVLYHIWQKINGHTYTHKHRMDIQCCCLKMDEINKQQQRKIELNYHNPPDNKSINVI